MSAQTDYFKCPNCEFLSEDINLVVNHVHTCNVSDESADHSLPNPEQGSVEIYEHGSQETAGATATGSTTTTPQSGHGWSHAATLLLIEAFRLRKHWFEDSTKKKSEVWRDIAKELQTKGYSIDGTACDQKMRTLKKRYKIIKENACLSGRGAVKQWQYFNVMDELMRGDPAIVPIALEATFSTPSTSTGITHHPHQQANTSLIPPGTPSPSMSPVPSPAPSPFDSSPAMSPAESSGDGAMHPPSEKRPRKPKVVTNFLESIAASSKERSVAVHDFMDTLKVQQVARNEQVKDLLQTIQSLQERLSQVQEQRVAECKEMQQQHHQELKDLRQQHHQELERLRQEHKKELKELQERFWQMQQQQQDKLLQVMQQRGQNP